MNDLSVLRGPYNQKIITKTNENRHSISMSFMWGQNVFD